MDKGYHQHGVTDKQVLTSISKNLPASIKRALKRRSAIELHSGHMKSESKLGLNYLKGQLGDQLNVILLAIGHIRLILNHLRVLFGLI